MASKKPDADEVEGWVEALRDRDGLTRERARERLVRLGPQATPFLVPLLSEHAAQTRWEAAKALSEIADPYSIPALLRVLDDDDNDVSWLAAEALAAIGPPSAAPVLQTLIVGIKSVAIRQGAHHVLGELRRTGVRDAIIEVYQALDSTHPGVEIVAAAERGLRALKQAG